MYDKIDKKLYTPMMRQYLTIKENYPDALVFFRLGDFYEMFFNDAIVASKELEIVLTGRDAGSDEKVPMCGVPYHAVNSYLDKLTSKGYKIAIVEQVEDPKVAQGIVKRDVVRVITPGTVIEGANLEEKENNFIASVSKDKDRYIFSYSDLSTGENYLTNIPLNGDLLIQEILNLKIKEIVISSDFNQDVFSPLSTITQITYSIENNNEKIGYLSSLSDNLDNEENKNFLRLLNYIIKTQKRVLVHMQEVIKYDVEGYMKMDLSSRKNLELLETLRFQNTKNTLFNVLDRCKSAMGSRYLKRNITFPLVNKDKIEERYNIIEKMQEYFIETDDLRDILNQVYDLERIVGKISYENANPKDLLQLKKSLSSIPELTKLLDKIKINKYFSYQKYLEEIIALYNLINKSIRDDAPFVIKDGGIIKENFDSDFDELKKINLSSKDYLLNLEKEERNRTGIKNLKVGFNRVFGYYIEISKGNINLVKDEYGYIRKQTLSNCERYITQELKEKEALILRAEEKMLNLEYELFIKVRNICKDYINILQLLSKDIAYIDMMQSFALIALENNYSKPVLNGKKNVEIKEGRHPVIEKYNSDFIPNDIKMNKENTILLITGPNMSGKSTYMRQIALISIMAQVGSFVPARKAILPIFDAVYTRIGASDDIVSGQSTFMVEMTEVEKALKNATENSLIIFDEIGRGTATYDGMSLAQAIIEFVHEKINCITLFSTHYHELTTLDKSLLKLRNVHVSIEEKDGDVIFMHKVFNGPVDKSYGINVAKLAGLPLEVTLRARDLLTKFENGIFDSNSLSIKNYNPPLLYDSKTDKEIYVLNALLDADLNKISPLEALNMLNKLQEKIRK